MFDDNYFATGVEFHIERDMWRAEISLDKSDLYMIPAGAARWDQAQWDQAYWQTA